MDGDARQLTTPTTFILALTPSAFCSGHSGRPALRPSTYFAGCSGFRYGPSTFWRTLEIRSAGLISSNRAISLFASLSRPASAQLPNCTARRPNLLPYGTLRTAVCTGLRIEPWVSAIGGRRRPCCAQTKDDGAAHLRLPRNGDECGRELSIKLENKVSLLH